LNRFEIIQTVFGRPGGFLNKIRRPGQLRGAIQSVLEDMNSSRRFREASIHQIFRGQEIIHDYPDRFREPGELKRVQSYPDRFPPEIDRFHPSLLASSIILFFPKEMI
jgi:hypothetical protein